MSQENVEVVRRTTEAVIRGDDDFVEAFDADVEWTTAADEPDPQTYRGIEGVRSLVRVSSTSFGRGTSRCSRSSSSTLIRVWSSLSAFASRAAKVVSSWKPRRPTSTS
jgi:ketosteroid isomerase-like protein